MLRLIGVVVSVGLADSLNPVTVGPALYLATLSGPLRRVVLFTLGVASVNIVGGLALALGPAHFLLALVPHPQRTVRHVIELAAGVLLIGAAAGLWLGRRRLSRRELTVGSGGAGSALLAGASLAAVEFPTAAPYFAVIAAVAASSASLLQQVALLLLYNVAFLLPLLAIIVVLMVAGERANRWLQRAGVWLQRRWPVVLAGLFLIVGGGLVIAGGAGLVKD